MTVLLCTNKQIPWGSINSQLRVNDPARLVRATVRDERDLTKQHTAFWEYMSTSMALHNQQIHRCLLHSLSAAFEKVSPQSSLGRTCKIAALHFSSTLSLCMPRC
jgi:hypothetical protein